MASAQLLQRTLLTSPCLYSSHRRPAVLQCSLTSALSSDDSGKPFQKSIPQIRIAENLGLNHRPLQGRLKASPDDAAQPDTLEAATKWILDFASSNFLPLVLLTGVTAGLVYPHPGQVAQQWGLSKWSTFGIFLISGLTLKTGDMLQAASAWPAALFGVVSILFITPLASIPILHLPLTPKELATGLAIFCCVPTTLSSGVSLTQLAGANTALALFLTITTNLVGIFTMPFMLSSLVGRSVGISLPAGPLLKALVESLLVPLLLGKLFRELSGYASFLDENKRYMSMMSSSLLALCHWYAELPAAQLLVQQVKKAWRGYDLHSTKPSDYVPWMQASCSRNMLLQIDLVQLLASITCGIGLHTVYLVWNTLVMRFLPAYWGNKGGDQVSAARAVILLASQKTLPVLVAVVATLNGVLGEAGLLVLPCIATHLSQIIYDSMLVSYWLGADKSANLKTA